MPYFFIRLLQYCVFFYSLAAILNVGSVKVYVNEEALFLSRKVLFFHHLQKLKWSKIKHIDLKLTSAYSIGDSINPLTKDNFIKVKMSFFRVYKFGSNMTYEELNNCYEELQRRMLNYGKLNFQHL